MIEPIPNYDDRKTTPPDEPEAKGYCTICGQPFWEGDAIYAVDGGRCYLRRRWVCLRNVFERKL